MLQKLFQTSLRLTGRKILANPQQQQQKEIFHYLRSDNKENWKSMVLESRKIEE